MRTRTRNKDFTHVLEATIDNGGMPGLSSVNYGVGQSWLTAKPETMKDVVSPGIFKKLREGKQLPVNTLEHDKYDIVASYDSFDWDITNSSYPAYTAQGHFHGHVGASALHSIAGYRAVQFSTSVPNMYPLSSPTWPSTATVLQNALAEANTSRWDLLTFVAEFDKTNELVGKFKSRTLKRAEQVAKSYSSKVRKAQRTVRGFQDTWLEARYGWRILMYDYMNASEAIEKLQQKSVGYVRHSSYDEESNSDLSVYPNLALRKFPPNYGSSYSVNLPLTVNCEMLKTHRRSVHAGVAVEHLGNDMYFANPLLTAWELVPFSFVVDWFTNINDAIAAHTPYASTNLLWSYVTTRDERIVDVYGSVYPSYPGGWPATSGYVHQYGAARPFDITYSQSRVVRAPQSPTVSLSYDLNFDYAKAIDLVALIPALRSLFKGFGIVGSVKLAR